MKSNLALLVILFFNQSLFAQSLDNDSTANAVLSKKEISAYQALMVFSETRINCNQIKVNKEKCWIDFLNSSAFDTISGAIDIPWSLKNQNNFIQKINLKEVTDSIWLKSWSFNPRTKDTADYYDLNFNGKLGTLYSTAAKDNRIWEEIWETIEIVGEIPPSLHAGIFQSEINKLLFDPKMRLLMSLQLMTIIKNN